MTFEEWWEETIAPKGEALCRYDKAEAAWEASFKEGVLTGFAMKAYPPEGYALVPIEPTGAMLDAGAEAKESHSPDCDLEKYSAFECPECTCRK